MCIYVQRACGVHVYVSMRVYVHARAHMCINVQCKTICSISIFVLKNFYDIG